ncbi:MAG: hypothetical protein K0S09_1299 [Sphingobacteriaceae bacterium]|jgi:hypothetical protein|nr:hypothetical protein [Sphingobacteriaceae bacterium]
MNGFKTHFLQNGHRTDVSITPLDNDCFGVELERTGMDEERDPTNETHAAMRSPDMVVQHTKNGHWLILDQGTFELNDGDLQNLGRAIEENTLT